MIKTLSFVFFLLIFELISIGIFIALVVVFAPELTREAGREIGIKYGNIVLFLPLALTTFLCVKKILPGFREINEN